MLSSTMTVLEENEESLLSDLAPITDCTGTGHWVHFGDRGKWLTALSILILLLLEADVSFLLSMRDILNDKLLRTTSGAANSIGVYLVGVFRFNLLSV